MKIIKRFYTKTGDKGETTLRNGKKYSKADSLIEAIGAIDELNSALGIVVAQLAGSNNKGRPRSATTDVLEKVQSDLFHIGALLGGEKNNKQKRIGYLESRVSTFEKEIDKIQKGLPVQEGFVLPGGARPSAQLDFARAVCRRVERRVVRLDEIDKVIIKYLNRLSDYLYALARWTNFKLGKDEIRWRNNL